MKQVRTLTLAQLRRPDVAGVDDDLRVVHLVTLWDLFRQPVQLQAYAIFVCVGGELELSINARRYTIGPDTLAVNFPENVLCVHRHTRVEAYAVLLSQRLFSELHLDIHQLSRLYAHFREHVVYPLPHQHVAPLQHYFALLSLNARLRPPGADEILRGLLRAGILQLFSLIRLTHDVRLEHMEERPSRQAQIFSRFLETLALHCRSQREVRYYAGELCLTPRHLTTVVKAYSGRSASQWVSEYVIMEAKRLLTASSLTVQQVALSLTFPTQSAFGKYFKQATGSSPREFRQSLRRQG